MKTPFTPRSIRWLLLFALGVGCMSLFAGVATAADASVNLSASILQANFILDLVSDRARLIQVSALCVVLGIWLMWWRH